ncbi:hypothetical protein HYH03_015567 [Edaphochlamys debaryana]|uniref:Uncharacterized protein n=1 Tax=Edaphochlamys debaryana TaxID=47281 RepID=A0A836BSH2_9CHLO|nr:hypothetical protein HYH03_015567 [Edaphochlamys debaryana]|eukprot:KAG2485758.1 hypothetical protein HYH03_015567 [Edaphochlamys debaryana]
MVEPSCAVSNVTAAYLYCSDELTLARCGTGDLPPPTPPGTRRPPSPPPRISAPVTNLTGTVVLGACGKPGLASLLPFELTRELARVFGVSAASVRVSGTSINCGNVVNGQSVSSVSLNYWVVLPGTSDTQAAAAVASGQSLSKALSKTFTDRWGEVQASSMTGAGPLQLPAAPTDACAGGNCGPNLGKPSPGDAGGKRALSGFLVAIVMLATAIMVGTPL